MLPRKTIHISESTESLILSLAEEGESFSAAVSRLIEKAATDPPKRPVPRYVASGSSGIADLGRNSEKYLRESFADFSD